MAGNHGEAAVGVFEYEMAPMDSFQPESELGKGSDYFADLRRTKRQLPYSLGQLDPQLMGAHELRSMLRVGYNKVPFDCFPRSGVKLVKLPRLRVTSWQLYNRRYVKPVLVLLHHDIERRFSLRFQGTPARVLSLKISFPERECRVRALSAKLSGLPVGDLGGGSTSTLKPASAGSNPCCRMTEAIIPNLQVLLVQNYYSWLKQSSA